MLRGAYIVVLLYTYQVSKGQKYCRMSLSFMINFSAGLRLTLLQVLDHQGDSIFTCSGGTEFIIDYLIKSSNTTLCHLFYFMYSFPGPNSK